MLGKVILCFKPGMVSMRTKDSCTDEVTKVTQIKNHLDKYWGDYKWRITIFLTHFYEIVRNWLGQFCATVLWKCRKRERNKQWNLVKNMILRWEFNFGSNNEDTHPSKKQGTHWLNLQWCILVFHAWAITWDHCTIYLLASERAKECSWWMLRTLWNETHNRSFMLQVLQREHWISFFLLFYWIKK